MSARLAALVWVTAAAACDVAFLVGVSIMCDELSTSLSLARAVPAYVFALLVFGARLYHYVAFVRTAHHYRLAGGTLPLPYSDLRPLAATIGQTALVVCLLATPLYARPPLLPTSTDTLLATWAAVTALNIALAWRQDDRPHLRRMMRERIDRRRRHESRARRVVFGSRSEPAIDDGPFDTMCEEAFAAHRFDAQLSESSSPRRASDADETSEDELIDVDLDESALLALRRRPRSESARSERTEAIFDHLDAAERARIECKLPAPRRTPPPPKPPKMRRSHVAAPTP